MNFLYTSHFSIDLPMVSAPFGPSAAPLMDTVRDEAMQLRVLLGLRDAIAYSNDRVNSGDFVGFIMENHRKTIGKQENHRKTIGK